jgi:hypothetical protein
MWSSMMEASRWSWRDGSKRSGLFEPELEPMDEADMRDLELALTPAEDVSCEAEYLRARGRFDFHYMLMDGVKELSYVGAWENKDAVYQFQGDRGWEDYPDATQQLFALFLDKKINTFLLYSSSHYTYSFQVYAVDLKNKTQKNMASGKMRKMRVKSDPLSSFSNKCRAEPITSEMLGEEADTFLCPILQDIPLVPVIASDGHMYDYDALRNWMKVKKESPMTKEELSPVIKAAIRDRSLMESVAKRQRSS